MLNKFEFLWISCPLLPISLTRGQCIQAGKFWREKEAGARGSRLASQRSRILHQSISIPSFTIACSRVFAQVWEAVTGWAQGGMRLGTENMLHTALDNKTERERFKLVFIQFSLVQLLSRVRLFATPWIAARQASLSITNSRSLLKPMSIESVMPSNHLILCRPLLLLPPIPPSIRVFSNESTLRIRWGQN